MTHLKNTTRNFVERMRKTAIYAIAPLYGLWLDLKETLTGQHDSIQKAANIFVSIVSLPILLALTALTLPLGTLAAACQIIIFPLQCLVAKLRDCCSNQENEQEKPLTHVSTQMSGLNLKGTTAQSSFSTPLIPCSIRRQSQSTAASESKPTSTTYRTSP